MTKCVFCVSNVSATYRQCVILKWHMFYIGRNKTDSSTIGWNSLFSRCRFHSIHLSLKFVLCEIGFRMVITSQTIIYVAKNILACNISLLKLLVHIINFYETLQIIILVIKIYWNSFFSLVQFMAWSWSTFVIDCSYFREQLVFLKQKIATQIAVKRLLLSHIIQII